MFLRRATRQSHRLKLNNSMKFIPTFSFFHFGCAAVAAVSVWLTACSKPAESDPFAAAPKPAPGAPTVGEPVEPKEPLPEIPALAALARTNVADIAWDSLLKMAEPATPPEEWQTKRPAEAEIAKFREGEAKRMAATAEQAKVFYTKFPQHEQAVEAKEMEYELLRAAVRLGQTNQTARVEAIETEMLKDPALDEEQKFKLRFRGVERTTMLLKEKGEEVMLAAYEQGIRQLQKEFPKRQEVYGMLMEVASNIAPGDKAKEMAKEIAANATDEEVKERATLLVKKLGLIGKPVALKFTALDKRAVDVAKLTGKVVLVDFWATWCGPCVKEIPNVRAAFEKLNAKGFEIVGISFDQQIEKLTALVEKEKMAWPQYFDGKGWENDFGKEFGITGLPAMWLIDKKGNLRDMNAREDLVAKVEKLLAE